MSIFPVKISEWYVEGKPFGDQIEMLSSMLDSGYFKCHECGKSVKFDSDGWVYHSITFGGCSTVWCSDNCFNKEEK